MNKNGLPSSKKAVAYLQSRCIDYRQTEVAFNSGGLHGESKNHHLLESMVLYGLLKARPGGGYNVWAKDCVIFPLKNADNKIVSLYGRSTTDNKDQRHFYLTGREEKIKSIIDRKEYDKDRREYWKSQFPDIT